MAKRIRLTHRTGVLEGRVPLVSSKSISNRLLLIRALSGVDFPIYRLSDAEDTRAMVQCLQSGSRQINAGEGGTTYRFMMAYLAFQPGEQELFATGRMQERPVGELVDALNALGARISYLGKKGFPPLRLSEPSKGEGGQTVLIRGDKSSQFITALLLLGPLLPGGLRLHLIPPVVSGSYIQMTIALMNQFGVEVQWKGNELVVPPQPYRMAAVTVESDWSAASYFYSMAALSSRASLHLEGLIPDSVQGDAVIASMMGAFSVQSEYTSTGVHLFQGARRARSSLTFDFLDNPDLAQTMAVVCAARGVSAEFSGLQTLRIKETDRLFALQTELQKVGVRASSSVVNGSLVLKTEGNAQPSGIPVFDTWGDHRMAMAFAPLSLLFPIEIREPEVVRKSYPSFWEDLQQAGFEITEFDE